MSDSLRFLKGIHLVPPSTFSSHLDHARGIKRHGHTVGESVDALPRDVREYSTWQFFLSDDGLTGGAVHKDGYLSHLFNVGIPGYGTLMQFVRIGYQVTAWRVPKLFCYDYLVDFYKKTGWVETRREPWNPEFAPPGFSREPQDVVWMHYPKVHREVQISQAFQTGAKLWNKTGGTLC